MHSVNEPMEEARRLYIEQSGLSERLSASPASAAEPLVVWDVGLGAATNAMAAITCHQALNEPRALALYSFELDLDPLRLCLKHAGRLPWLHHPAPAELLSKRVWSSPCGRLTWILVTGDFQQTLTSAPAPDVIFYDPFSPKTNSPLWTFEHFAALFRMANPGCKLLTYSASTAVRVALLRAGWLVGKGYGTGPKAETTVAYKGEVANLSETQQLHLLDAQWLRRWERSQARYPDDVHEEARPAFDSLIRSLPQFSLTQRPVSVSRQESGL